MDLTYPPEAEAFRAEFRAWLHAHLDERFRGLRYDLEGDDPDRLDALREWNGRLADAGYAAIAWPVEFGGRGAGLLEQVVFAEEVARAEAPPTLNPLGIANIAPAILAFGTEDQKRRHLPGLLRGDEIWCQGFSEPDAGSDLASLSCAAVRDGDHYVVNGQKVWNTLGSLASWCELLVRTDPIAPKHRGVSCLLVDMSLPGIEVRPLVTITGEREFSELFFTDVRVPAENLLGQEHDGWNVAMTTLMYERSGVANLHLGLRRKVQLLIDLARDTPRNGCRAADDPVIRRRLADAYMQGECLKLLADRAISGALNGDPFGPESSIAKLVWSNLGQELGQIAGEIAGMDALARDWGHDIVYSRALSIAGGTTQVNKNVIAERILGLPKG